MDISYQIPRAALGWMLISVLLVIIPLSVRMPVWVSVIAIVCIFWRLLIFTGNLNFPGRLMRIAVVVFTLIISVSQMRNLGVGLDSAASLLALGFVFKLIEMRQKRDIYVVISLCFVMLMVAFLYSQSVLMTLYIAAVVTIITGAMITLNRSPLIVDTAGTLAMAGKIFLQAVPLTVVCSWCSLGSRHYGRFRFRATQVPPGLPMKCLPATLVNWEDRETWHFACSLRIHCRRCIRISTGALWYWMPSMLRPGVAPGRRPFHRLRHWLIFAGIGKSGFAPMTMEFITMSSWSPLSNPGSTACIWPSHGPEIYFRVVILNYSTTA